MLAGRFAIAAFMSRNRARLYALLGSTAAAAILFFVGLHFLSSNRVVTTQVHQVEPPPVEPSTPSVSALPPDARPLDPVDPKTWRFYLDEKDADTYFFISASDRTRYDPWTYSRDVGNLNDEFKWPGHPKGKWTWRSNSLGCREDHELDDPPRDLRVLVAGDSHTCGVCNDDESFTNLLESAIAKNHAGKTVEALNTGLGGYTFFNYLGAIYRFRAFKPQVMVVAVFGGNDFAELVPLYFHFIHKQMPSLSGKQWQRRKDGLKASNDVMGQGFASLDTFRDWPEQQDHMVRAATEVCLEIRRAAAAQHTELVIVLIPSPFDFEWPNPPKRIEDTRVALDLKPDDLDVSRRMCEEFLAALRAKGMQPIDMYPIFEHEPEPPYWHADFHLNVRGHQLVADALTPVVDAALSRE